MDSGKVASVILLSGVYKIDRINELQQIANEAKENIDSIRDESEENLNELVNDDEDELESLF